MKRILEAALAMIALACADGARATQPGLPDLPSCAHASVPENAGVVATPGGFMLVHPRNADLPDDYTGCKTLWVMDLDPEPWHWATLWFRDGRLQRVVSTSRDASAPHACDMPGMALPEGFAPAPAWCWRGWWPTAIPRCTTSSTSTAATHCSWKTCRFWERRSSGYSSPSQRPKVRPENEVGQNRA